MREQFETFTDLSLPLFLSLDGNYTPVIKHHFPGETKTPYIELDLGNRLPPLPQCSLYQYVEGAYISNLLIIYLVKTIRGLALEISRYVHLHFRKACCSRHITKVTKRFNKRRSLYKSADPRFCFWPEIIHPLSSWPKLLMDFDPRERTIAQCHFPRSWSRKTLTKKVLQLRGKKKFGITLRKPVSNLMMRVQSRSESAYTSENIPSVWGYQGRSLSWPFPCFCPGEVTLDLSRLHDWLSPPNGFSVRLHLKCSYKLSNWRLWRHSSFPSFVAWSQSLASCCRGNSVWWSMARRFEV